MADFLWGLFNLALLLTFLVGAPAFFIAYPFIEEARRKEIDT